MAKLEIIEDVNSYLMVRLRQGESFFCPLGRTIMMDATLDLHGQLRDNITNAAFKKMVAKVSFFFQSIEAVRGDGTCVLVPDLPGALRILDIGEIQYNIVGGQFVAASVEAKIAPVMQDVDKVLFAKTGGLFILETGGFGQVVISGFGTLHEIDVVPGHPVIIDNSHVVAWEDTLEYALSISTTQDGLLMNAINSIKSAAGIVLRFSGYGKLIICSRNKNALVDWVVAKGYL